MPCRRQTRARRFRSPARFWRRHSGAQRCQQGCPLALAELGRIVGPECAGLVGGRSHPFSISIGVRRQFLYRGAPPAVYTKLVPLLPVYLTSNVFTPAVLALALT